MNKREVGLLTYLASVSLLSLLISFLIDAVSFRAAFEFVYHTQPTPLNIAKFVISFILVLIVTKAVNWFFAESKLFLDSDWVGWALTLQNLSWLLAPLGDIGIRIIFLMHNILIGGMLTWVVVAGSYEILNYLKEKGYSIRFPEIFPKNMDAISAIVSASLGLLLKAIILNIL